MGILGAAEPRIVGGGAQRTLVHVDAAEDDRAGAAQAGDHLGVGVGDAAAIGADTGGPGQAGDRDVGLNQDRRAIHMTERRIGRPAGGAGVGGGLGPLGIEIGDGAQGRIEPRDAGQIDLDRLDRRDGPGRVEVVQAGDAGGDDRIGEALSHNARRSAGSASGGPRSG